MQLGLRVLDEAYQAFFQKQNDFPKFKSRPNSNQSYTTVNNGAIRLEGNQLRIPKFGLVRFAKSREIEGRILSATARRNPSRKFFVSVLCETDIGPMPEASNAVGIDLGVKDFAVSVRWPKNRKSEALAQVRKTVGQGIKRGIMIITAISRLSSK